MLIFRPLRGAPCRALLASALLVTAPARAQAPTEAPEPPLRLTWETDDPACSGGDVAARALGMVTPGVAPRPLRAHVEVQREEDRWLVRLQTQSGEQTGRRILRAQSCSELQEAIALLLAMTLESKGDVLPPAPEPPTPEGPAPPAPPAPPSPAPSPAPAASEVRAAPAPEAAPRGTQLGAFLQLDAKGAAGLKPGLGIGVGLGGGLWIGAFDLGLEVAHWPETREDAGGDRPGYVGVQRQELGLQACWNVWRAGGLILAPCLRPALVRFRYRTRRVPFPREGTAGPLPSLHASLGLRYQLLGEHLSVLVRPGLSWEVAQPFEVGLTDLPVEDQPAPEAPPVTGSEEIYKTMGFGARLELGLDARF